VRLLPLLPLLAALILAAGCGGDGGDESSAQAWADDFCSAAGDWRTSLEDVVSGISPSDLSADGVRDAIDEGLEATEEFVDEIRGLDAPETEAGQQVAEAVDGMADSVEATADELGTIFGEDDSLQDLITKVPQAAAQIAQLEDELQSSFEELEGLDTGELRDELSSNEDCAAARSGSGS
jgi:ABC-type transporter Mla subunit MlaD